MTSGLPIGPIPTISHTTALTFFVASAVGVVLVLSYAVYDYFARRSLLLFWCMLGSVFCNPVEPFWDALGALRFHEGNFWAFTMFPDLTPPVHYPWWAAFVYTYFSGVSLYVFFRMFENRVRLSTFWWFMLGQAVFNTLLEGVVITKAYDYYGEQPLRWGTDFPLYWVFTNYGEVLGAAVLLTLVRRYGSRASLAALVIAPSAFGAWELWTGWPVFATLNSDLGMGWRTLAAVVTAVISLSTLRVLADLMLGTKPVDTAEPALSDVGSATTQR
jgi:hypothetical protein